MCVCTAIVHVFFIWQLYYVHLRTEILISTFMIIQKLETYTKIIEILSRKSRCFLDEILLCACVQGV